MNAKMDRGSRSNNFGKIDATFVDKANTFLWHIFTKKYLLFAWLDLSIDNTIFLLLWKFETAASLLIEITSDQTRSVRSWGLSGVAPNYL